MEKIIHAQSGHTMFVKSVSFDELPEPVKSFPYMDGKDKLYVVKNFDDEGIVFMYIAKSKGEYVVWYRGGGFWSSFGKTIEEAINGAQKDGWMYA